ncbi:TonB-dependent receptor [Niveispirillum irakense]|uniref:TonB-dependent receptor n=1 Tax=Niveispirillum irakense TaxID=34011 RepID=UPI00041E99F0|nr:TonB-dependent receptor [Niveispirillum irakense]
MSKFLAQNASRRPRLKTRLLQCGALACALAAIPATAFAQDEAGGLILEEIIVTATKRATTNKDTPIAIAAVAGDAIEKSQAFSMESFARLNPSIQINNRGAGDNQIIVRGISSAGKPTVGLYFDETVITGLGLDGGSDNQPNIQLHDVERVEVLKGPQGTLFGASSMSGTVRVITNKPVMNEMEGRASMSVAGVKGGNSFFQGEAMVNAPIVEDKLAARAVVWGDNGGGYIDQVSGTRSLKNTNDQAVSGGRFSIKATPNERLSILLTALHQKIDVDGTQYYDYSAGPYIAEADTLQPFNDNTDLYSAVIDYSLDFGTITATTSYLDRNFFLARDSTPTARRFNIPALLDYHQAQDLSNWSSELRFASDFSGPVQIVVGGFYAEQRADSISAALVADPVSGMALCRFHDDCVASGLARDDINSAYSKTAIDQYALFAESNYQVTDQLTATAGIRYYDADIKEYKVTTQSLRFPSSPIQTAPTVALDESTAEDKISYNFALTYAATPDTSFYARAASGFRPGGTNDADGAAQYGVVVPARYTSDTLWNYEAGVKSYLLDRAVFAELSVYRIDWSNQQISVTDPGGTFAYISNAGKSYVNGVEFQVNARATQELSFNFGITYTDSKLSEDLPDTAATGGFDGDRIPYTPKWSFGGQVSYETDLTPDIQGYLTSNFNYRGSSYSEFNDTNDNYQRLDDYFLLGLRAGARFGTWDASLYVENLTDKAAEIGLRVTGDGYRVYTTRPRTIGGTLSTTF